MNAKRAEVIGLARALIGSRFVHAGRVHGGVDCVGTIVLPLRDSGLPVADREGYTRFSSGTMMPDALAEIADRIERGEAVAGDLLTFWISKAGREEHVAWLSEDNRIIHCWGHPVGQRKVKGVCEVSLDKRWRDRLVGAWRVRGMD